MPEAARGYWRDLVEERLPRAATADWPVRLDHCFARILLDNTCGGLWREQVRAPAWANLSLNRLAVATDLGEAVLDGRADLHWLNRRSLALRGKLRGTAPFAPVEPPPERLDGDGLVLRRWRPEDAAALAALNADPEVMRFFPACRDAEASRVEAQAFARRFAVDGFGPWVIEVPDTGFVGFVGGARLVRVMPFPGGDRPGETVEMVWRLARSAWGRGIAVQAARLGIADLFGRCGLCEIVAFTAEANGPSRRLMERLGMAAGGAFAHPGLPAGHPLRAHLLYRLNAAVEAEGSGA